MSSTMGRIPPVDEVCPRCLSGWDFDNVHNYYFTAHGDKKSYHQDCHDLKVAEEERVYFLELLDSAIHYKSIRAIPSGYSRSGPRPWFIVETSVGPIKIGWRKRVISIHWKNAPGLKDINGNELFADQSVTTGTYRVHAWDKDKAIEYLKKLVPVLDQLAGIRSHESTPIEGRASDHDQEG